MSVIIFELKEEHIKLLKHLRWSTNNVQLLDNSEWKVHPSKLIINISEDDDSTPFNENNIYDAIDIILNGVPEDFNPFETYELKEYSLEQKAEWDKLYSELPTALDIILFNGHFNLGTYRTKFHDRNWKKQTIKTEIK
jgi:hypothetical protein